MNRATGLSIGNSHHWNGIRLNWRDRDVNEINGINYGSGTTFTATPSKLTPINSTSLTFDPADSSYARVDYDARLNSTSFTVELWAKVEGGQGSYRTAVMSRGGVYEGYTIYAGDDNK